MDIILLFFALPVAVIILSIVLEKILRCPILTAATFFAIFLIVAFAVFDATFLIFVIAYTIIAFITAVIAEFFFRRCCDDDDEHCRKCCCQNISGSSNCENNSRGVIRLSDRDINAIATQLANIQDSQNQQSCGCSQDDIDTVAVNVRDTQTGNRTSWRCYRR